MTLELASPPSEGDASRLPIAVLGAGPVGLAAGAHLLERGLDFVVLEAAGSVGADLLDCGDVRLFSPWRGNVDAAMAKPLGKAGWVAPDPEALALAREVVETAMRPYPSLPDVASRLRLGHRVPSASREGFDKARTPGRDEAAFLLRVEHDGMDVLGTDRARCAGERVLVVGSGHSAANALLDPALLAESNPRTRLVRAVRGRNLARAHGAAPDPLPARGELGARLESLAESGKLEFVPDFRVAALSRRDGAITVFGLGPNGERRDIAGIDEMAAALAGDIEAADRVELDLPETGVCGVPTRFSAASRATGGTTGGCCGPALAEPVAIAVPAATSCRGPKKAEALEVAVSASAPAGCCTPAAEAEPIAPRKGCRG